MTHNYTIEKFDNINNHVFITTYENLEIDYIILQDFIVELFDILKVNIMLLVPFIVPILVGYIIGKIHLNITNRCDDFDIKFIDVNKQLSKYDSIINEIEKINYDINQQISDISNELESIKYHINIMNELLCSEINNNNIFKKNINEKISIINKQVKQLDNRIANIETKENYVLIGYRKSTDIPVFVSTEITKISSEEIKKYHLHETCIILPLLTSLPKLKEIYMTQLDGLWLSFEKIILKKPGTDKLMYAGFHMAPGHHIHPKDSPYRNNIPKIESFCNSIGVKLIFNNEPNNENIY